MDVSSRSRVIMVVSHLAPVFGLERVALDVLQLLRKTYDVEIVCVGGSHADTAECPDARLLGSSLRGFRRLHSLRRLRGYARTLESETVILVGVWVAVPWLLVARGSGRRTLVWEHSMMKARLEQSKQLRLLALAARFLYRRASAVVAVSRPLESDLASICKGVSIVTIPNPVLIEASGLSAQAPPALMQFPQRKTTRMLTVGSLTSVKAQHLVIRALALLDDSYILSIAGSGPEERRLTELARELGVASRVTFEGFVAPSDLKGLMSESDLMVHCAVVETFGLVYVEAANAGLSVIATRNSLAEEMIPKFVPGRICEPDAPSLAKAIASRKTHVVSPTELSLAAALRGVEFDPDRVASRWTSLIDARSDSDCLQKFK
ncbi:glycosyltransferase [Arthrobacter sp. UYEF36]|uniref:glycosyltransferase n=1 Tax=Arthrobacter sp. UYEF36 TaxID=1756366 RepID=UPI00339466D4